MSSSNIQEEKQALEIIPLHHTVDAKHIKNLGEQSVSSLVQAITEIAKNSYDADAHTCTVNFYGSPKPTIEDENEKHFEIDKID